MSFITSSQRAVRVSLTLGSLGCLLGSAQALADSPAYAPRSETVNYRDLDLTTVSGATTLYRRIEGAARFSCGYVGRSLFEQSEWKICRQQAIADAVVKIDSPLLTAVYNRERPESSATAMLHR